MWSRLRGWLQRARGELGEPDRPVPAVVWATLAVLLCAILFLALRLLVLRANDAPAALPARLTQDAGARPPGAPPPRPPASPEALRTFVERWRHAWTAKDLEAYLGFYSVSFGAQGKDLAAWAEAQGRSFSGPDPISVEVSAVESSLREHIAIVSFDQVYRSGSHTDRGRKTLYLVPAGGEWRIFNEEFQPGR